MGLVRVNSNNTISTGEVRSDIVVSFRHDLLFQALGCAASITSHYDFYNWLQDDIYPFIPHQTLLAAWGNFDTQDLTYDVSSRLPGLSTRKLADFTGVDDLMSRLFGFIQRSDKSWYMLKNLREATAEMDAGRESQFYKMVTKNTETLLLYAMRDERGDRDCLYVFSIVEPPFEVDPLILELLMPHVDSALRRIKCLPAAQLTCGKSVIASDYRLSARELEVIEWVSAGKSNPEIGAILNISHNTVKNHLKRIFKKMSVTARSQAVMVHLQNQAQAT
jgi:transcriptional regulator EpsA